jgi:hypothetical protein
MSNAEYERISRAIFRLAAFGCILASIFAILMALE